MLVQDTRADGTEARFSMLNEGVRSFTTLFAFISPDRAYYIDTLSGFSQVVVWDPSEMVVTSSFSVPSLNREGFDTQGGTPVLIDDFVVMPINYTARFQGEIVRSTTMVVFSATEDRFVQLVEDERCVIARSAFVEDGMVYLIADSLGGAVDRFAPPDLVVPPACLLRWIPGDDVFDPSFYLDLRELVGEPFINSGTTRGDGTFVTQAYTSDIDPLTLGLFELLDDDLWQWTIVDFRAETSTVLTSIPPGGIQRSFVIDGQYYVPLFDDSGSSTTLFRLEDDGTATELLSVTTEFLNVQPLR